MKKAPISSATLCTTALLRHSHATPKLTNSKHKHPFTNNLPVSTPPSVTSYHINPPSSWHTTMPSIMAIAIRSSGIS
ncbi:MAG: hypothetical protein J5506_06075 [Prevotella sp.]|nr:hypothetical protein [Prevotella sp.]